VGADRVKFEEVLRGYPAAWLWLRGPGGATDEALLTARVHQRLETQQQLAAGRLSRELPAGTAGLAANPSASVLTKALAALVQGDFARAEELAQGIRPEATDAGAAETALLAGVAALGAGSPARALDQFAATVSAAGTNLALRAVATHGRALALHELERHAEAETAWREVVKDLEQSSGTEAADTLRCRGHLAACLLAQDHPEDAARLLEPLLAAFERVLGAEAPETLGARNTLAETYNRQGRFAEAEHEFRAVLAGRERALGAGHPATLQGRADLAGVLKLQGRLAEAEQEVRAVFTARERVLGPDHRDTLMACFNLAVAMAEQGRFAEARPLVERAHAGTRELLGEEHPHTRLMRQVLGALKNRP